MQDPGKCLIHRFAGLHLVRSSMETLLNISINLLFIYICSWELGNYSAKTLT
ncbi:unnamed protein product [Acanthoscelides obtectus]|uniref:Uncharacterized protein n=1 Tax=Acanthoscelides obtectus TaxID=200917 RepID=A0A9P0KAK8_ACAOB|nr:unnamed protein product [Acanthoscelides obtectus]CAK1648393.1 hypothetical protein AOBTE_LOCUS15699 [Acanthoscelides obtectus]